MPTALVLPGTAGNYASAPDSAALSITSDITLLARVALDDWTPAAVQTILAKSVATGNQRSYTFIVTTAGLLRVNLSSAGTAFTAVSSSVAPTISDGQALWVLVSWRNSDDRVQFFTAPGHLDDPAASDFTKLGTDQTITLGGIFNSTATLEVGTQDAGATSPAAGKFYRARVYNGVFSTAAFGGTQQFDARFEDVTRAGTRNPTTFTESSANTATVTLNGTTWDWLVAVTATASATLSLTATAAGVPTVLGAASSTVTLTATASGLRTVSGAAASTLTLTATATGVRTVFGVAAQTITLTATAAGVPTVSGVAAQAVVLTATASGVRTVFGAGTAAVTLTATVAGAPVRSGTATATITLTVTVTGAGARPGIAAAVLLLAAIAEGVGRRAIFRSPTRPNIAYQYPRGESTAARALSRHLAVTVEGINVFILTDDTVTTTRPDDATTIRRTLWGGHEEPVDTDERALLVGAGYGGNLS